jgi:hypothetical protein
MTEIRALPDNAACKILVNFELRKGIWVDL